MRERAGNALDSKQWFAARFFFDQLIRGAPQDPAVAKWQERRREAEMNLRQAKQPANP